MDVDAAFSLISRAIDAGRSAHGYLLVGDLAGSCAELTRRILLKLFSDAPSQVEAKTHPDVVYLEPAGAKAIISVEAMRARIVEPMSLASFSGGWKVGVIVGADRMEAPSANAFLKSIEEPSPRTLYLLLTDQPDVILPTIVSRTQRIDLPRGDDALPAEAAETVADAFAAKDAVALAGILAALKEEADDVSVQLVRKRFFRTIMGYVRTMLVDGSLPLHQSFRNITAVEEAYRQSCNSMSDEAVLSFMLDRIVFPKKAEEGGR